MEAEESGGIGEQGCSVGDPLGHAEGTGGGCRAWSILEKHRCSTERAVLWEIH